MSASASVAGACLPAIPPAAIALRSAKPHCRAPRPALLHHSA